MDARHDPFACPVCHDRIKAESSDDRGGLFAGLLLVVLVTVGVAIAIGLAVTR